MDPEGFLGSLLTSLFCFFWFRLRNELEKQEGEHKELLSQLHNRHTSEMDHIGEQMMETENMRTTFEKEVREHLLFYPFL